MTDHKPLTEICLVNVLLSNVDDRIYHELEWDLFIQIIVEELPSTDKRLINKVQANGEETKMNGLS